MVRLLLRPGIQRRPQRICSSVWIHYRGKSAPNPVNKLTFFVFGRSSVRPVELLELGARGNDHRWLPFLQYPLPEEYYKKHDAAINENGVKIFASKSIGIERRLSCQPERNVIDLQGLQDYLVRQIFSCTPRIPAIRSSVVIVVSPLHHVVELFLLGPSMSIKKTMIDTNTNE